MLKSKIALGVLALAGSTAACAQSSVTIYGVVDVGAMQFKTSGAGFTAPGTVNKIDSGNMTTSYFGFRGSEDLGGGLRAVFALESYIRLDTGEAGRFGTTDSFWKRNSYVGLDSSKYGRLLLGRNGLPLFTTTAAFNPFGASFKFAPIIAHMYNTDLTGVGINSSRSSYVVNDSQWSNSISYDAPTFVQGLQTTALYSFASGSNDAETPSKIGKAWSVAAHYLPKTPWSASATYQKVANIANGAAGAIDNQQAWMGGTAYDFSYAKLFAQYARLKTAVTGVGSDTDKTWQLGVSVPILQGSFMASYVKTVTSAQGGVAAADRDRKTWALGYNYFLSKRTDLYAAYEDSRLDGTVVSARGDKAERTIGAGLRHRF
jgi:predicted porin